MPTIETAKDALRVFAREHLGKDVEVSSVTDLRASQRAAPLEDSNAIYSARINGRSYVVHIAGNVHKAGFLQNIETCEKLVADLKGDVTRQIARPIYFEDGKEFAFSVYEKYLKIHNRLPGFALDYRLFLRDIGKWISMFSLATMEDTARYPEIVDKHHRGLEIFATLDDIDEKNADFARDYVKRNTINKGDVISCGMHGDFWTNNIMKSKSIFPNINDIRVIDWGSYDNIGSPYFDIVKFLNSNRFLPKNIILKNIDIYRRYTNISVEYMPLYIFSCLGIMKENLNYFPYDKYIALCNSKVNFVRDIIRAETG